MNVLMASSALILPWLAMAYWLYRWWLDPCPGRWPLAWGYGYILGFMGVALILRLQGAADWTLTPYITLSVFTTLLLAAFLWRPARTRSGAEPGAPPSTVAHSEATWSMTFWRWVAFGLVLAWLLIRFVNLALEVWWQPLFPWDAWTTWAARARVWSELEFMAPFVSAKDWLADTTGALYTIDAWAYPKTVSLIAAWLPLAFGGWNETLANLPWLGIGLALGLGFYGQARLWGTSPLTAIIFCWLLLSLPILNTQIALAGYADLWLATTLGLAFIAFLQWLRSGDRRQGLMALVLILACGAIKREGMIWGLLFLPALLVAKLGRCWLAGISLLAAILLGALWAIGGLGLDLPVLGHIQLGPGFVQLPYVGTMELGKESPWEPVLRHTLLYSQWHLLPYLLMSALVAAGFAVWRVRGTRQAAWRVAGLTWCLGSLTALYFLFFWTEASLWAIKATSINRVALHFVPAWLFWIMTVWLDYARPDDSIVTTDLG
ncbi:MAG: hypothetical protein IPN92_09310 [Chromatiaceae bacterium]|nr:hypothetical protein [Chromatiaceae bacterium]